MVFSDAKYKRKLIPLIFLIVLTVYFCSEYVSELVIAMGTTNRVGLSQAEGLDIKRESRERRVIMDMADIPEAATNIFFVESRCSTERTLREHNKGSMLTARQSCAVESTALTNPDRPVFVFLSCPLGDDFLRHSPHFVVRLFGYPNVHVVRLDNRRVFGGSPVQRLLEDKLLENSFFPVEHSSDIIRLVLLWRFGGTYCDLDVVTIRSLKGLGTNWAGSPSQELIANGVLNFGPTGEAHDMLGQVLEHVNQNYDRSNWASNGPLLVTPFILKLCRVSTVPQAVQLCRGNFTVFGKRILFPIHYSRAKDLFDPALGPGILDTARQDSYSVHFYSKMSHDMNITLGSTQAYALLAQEFCPQVSNNCGGQF